MTAWPTVQLREVADIAAGITLGRKTNEPDLKDVPYMRVANVKDGVLDVSDMKTVAATAREIEKWTLRDGDLLLTEGGDLDKLGRGACWRNQLPLCIHQNHIFRVRLPGDRYDPDFVSYQAGSPYGKAYFFAHAKKTTGIASINQGVLGAFPLLSPPLKEQRRIAARLKAQLAEVDTARRAAQAQVRDAALLRQRLLQQTFDTLTDVPHKVLGDHAHISSGVTPARDNGAYWQPAEIPWVKTGEIDFGPITEVQESISRVALAECSLSLLSPGTVLVAITGEGKTRGRSAVLEVSATTNQHAVSIAPNNTWDAYFLQLWLQSSYHDLRELSEGRGGSRSALSGGQIRALEIPAPDIEEQRRIVTRLKAQLTEADAIAQAAAAQLAEIDKLPQQLLAGAFNTTTPGGTP